jgi:hypothetical protein
MPCALIDGALIDGDNSALKKIPFYQMNMFSPWG